MRDDYARPRSREKAYDTLSWLSLVFAYLVVAAFTYQHLKAGQISRGVPWKKADVGMTAGAALMWPVTLPVAYALDHLSDPADL